VINPLDLVTHPFWAYVNFDSTGPAGHVDLFRVGGDWGALAGGIPHLLHGPGGDIGYVSVTGNIYVNYGGWVGLANPTVVNNGASSTLHDDGGGAVTIAPSPVVDPTTGNVTIPTYSYTYIGVDDSVFPGLGAGGALARVTLNGTATFTTTGSAQIGVLDMTGLLAGSTLSFAGTGQADVYYVTSDGDVNLTNSTTGSLISGSITGNLTNLVLKGTLGYMPGHSGAWVFGRDAAPATADPQTEPQYGYFRGTINGLDVGGNVGTISLGGALGDLRVVGSVTSVTVNSDHVTPAGGWDGVYGLVWSQQRLWSIEVGNGLADDGGGDVARAAIMSSASIGKVTVSGPHYTINGTPFGELNGSIIGGQDEILVLPDPNDPSKTINVPVDAVGEVLGTNGAYLTGNVISGELDAFRSDLKSYLTSNGTIGTVSFAGAGAMITGATIAGSHIRTVSTSADSNGIVSSTFMSTFPAPNLYAIGSVAAGGPGLSFCTFRVNGGSIGAVSGVGPVADIHDNFFFATDSLQSLTARNIYWNELHMPGLVGSITAKQDVHDNVAIVGAMGAVTSPGDFLANDFTVGGQIASITVGKTFNSRVVAQGPTANIKSVSVNGDISGWIESGSQIGKIVSKTGTIYATIITDSGAQPNVQLIQAISFQGYLGLAGNLVTLQVSSTLGSIGDVFTIGGSLGTLRVIGTAAVPSDLNSSFNVAGSIGTINVDGTLYGDITAQGDLNAVMLKGDLGGWVDTDADGILDTIVGGLQITGAINTLSMPANHSIFANVSVGGSINAITLKGGSIVGTMTSRYGKFGKISLTNGSVTGSLTSNGIDSLSVAGGNVTGDITLPKGSLKSLKMTGGTLSGNIDVQNGTIDSLSLVNVATTAGKRISASRGIGKAVIGAGMASDLVSGRGINSLTINGDVTGNISVENAVKSITIKGTINGATLRVGDRLDALTVNGLVNALVSSAGSIGKLTVKGNVTGSQVLAGLDVGADYVVSAPGGDDLLSPGSIGAVNISGTLTGSLLSAGVGAGADGDMTTWGDNTISWGLSSIGKGKIGGFGAGNILMADTSVDPALAAAATAGGGTVYVDTPTLVLVAPFGPNVFGIAAGRTTLAEPDGLALTLTGPGLASYDGAGNLYFEGTTSASKLTLSFSGTYGTTINVVGGEDSSLSAIVLASGITLGSVTIDGTVGALAASAANTSTWHLGDMGTLTLAGAQGMTLTANNITKWTFTGANTGGTFNAGAVGTLLVGGATDSDFTFDGAKSVTVRGNLGGDWISWSPIPTFTVAGNLSGSVALPNGDLNKLSVSGALDGVINVGQQTLSRGGGPAALYSGGLIGQVAVTGNFGGAANSSLRASGDIKSMTVRGAFLGLLSTSGALVSLTVGGDMSGRVWSAGTINSVKVGSMTSALLTSSTDILTVKITGDMTGSNIAAGFDPGDAGYNLALGGEAGNVQIDALTPLADQAPGNADTVLGGTIKLVTIGGGMYASAIAAAVNPGADGFFGSADDVAGGSGHVTKVVVAGMIFGSVNLSETYGVFATSAMPTVFIFGKQPFTSNGNASVGLV